MTLNRQQGLMGLDCVQQEEISAALEDCTDYVWTGSMKIVQKAGFLDDRIPGLLHVLARYQRWDGVVNDLTDDSTTLILTGDHGLFDSDISIRFEDTCKNPGQSSCGQETTVSEQSARGAATLSVNLQISGSGTNISYSLINLLQETMASGKMTRYFERAVSCNPCRHENSFDYQETTFPLPFFNFQGKSGDKNHISDARQVDTFFGTQKSKLEYSWDFVRKAR